MGLKKLLAGFALSASMLALLLLNLPKLLMLLATNGLTVLSLVQATLRVQSLSLVFLVATQWVLLS
jgi:hypothetical protein